MKSHYFSARTLQFYSRPIPSHLSLTDFFLPQNLSPGQTESALLHPESYEASQSFQEGLSGEI